MTDEAKKNKRRIRFLIIGGIVLILGIYALWYFQRQANMRHAIDDQIKDMVKSMEKK